MSDHAGYGDVVHHNEMDYHYPAGLVYPAGAEPDDPGVLRFDCMWNGDYNLPGIMLDVNPGADWATLYHLVSESSRVADVFLPVDPVIQDGKFFSIVADGSHVRW